MARLLTTVSLLVALAAVQPRATTVLGQIERDVTGDGKVETLRVTGVGLSVDELGVEFTVGSAGVTIYRFTLQRLTRTVGFDAGRRVLSAAEHRVRLSEFGQEFFAQQKFRRPVEFVSDLRASAPGRLAQVPDVIARDRSDSDSRAGSVIWEEILKSPATIFSFSPGGDAVEAIGWSEVAGRFYRLLDCC